MIGGRAAARLVILGTLLSACVSSCAEPEAVALEVVSTSSGFGLRLIAAPGVKINARLKPTLELDGGGRIPFDATGLTADSAYFTEPPHALVSGARARVAGTLRVSVCVNSASYCQTLALTVEENLPRT